MGLFGSIVKAVTAPAKAVVHTVEHAASTVAHTVEHAASSAVHTVEHAASTVTHAASSAVHHVTHTLGHVSHSALSAIHHTVHNVEHAASSAVHAIGHTASSAVHHVTHAVDHAAHSVIHAGEQVVNLAAHEVKAVGHAVEHAAVDVGKTMAHDAAHAFNTVTHGVSTLAHEAGHTVSGLAHAVGHGATAIGQGVAHAAEHAVGTAIHVAGDVVHTAGNVAGDLAHGNLGKAAHDLASGATHTASDLAHGASAIAHDAGHAASGVGHAVVEAGSAAASGALDMVGTAAGVAGSLAKDYEHAMGNLVTNAVDTVAQIAKSEVAMGYGAAGIAAHTVGTPIGEFYANVAKHYGDAVIKTLDHVQGAINNAVDKATHAGGDIANSLGHGADVLGHDGSKVVTDVSHGDFDAAAHDAGQFGKDAFQATKDFAAAEKEGAEALAAIGTGITTTLGALNEAMARAGGGFVSAVGETMGGDAGHALAGAGDFLGDKTAMTANLVQGNFEAAAVEGAKVLGEAAGQWAGDHIVKDLASSLGDKFGGVVGDGIKALGDAGADALKGALKDLAGSAAGKGIDVVKGGDDHSPKSDSHADAADHSAKPAHEPSLMEKGQHAIDDFVHGKIDQAGDYLQKVSHDPQVLFNQVADMIKDHYGKGTADALAKLLGVQDPSHANDAAHTADGAPIGTSHAALTTETAALEQAAHGDGHGSDTSALAHALTEGSAASHAADLQSALQNAMHIFSDASPQLLSLGALGGGHGEQAHGAENGIIVIGGHEVSFDHGMPVHAELPMMLDNHFAHQLV